MVTLHHTYYYYSCSPSVSAVGSTRREGGVPAYINLSASSMLMIAMQYTSNPVYHCQLLECLMKHKQEVWKVCHHWQQLQIRCCSITVMNAFYKKKQQQNIPLLNPERSKRTQIVVIIYLCRMQDLLYVISYGPSQVKPPAVQMLFHYWPNLKPPGAISEYRGLQYTGQPFSMCSLLLELSASWLNA